MAKKKPGQVPNRHIYTRISFLYQAAAYLSQPAINLPDPNTAGEHLPQAVNTGAAAPDCVQCHANHTPDQTEPIQVGSPISINQNLSRKFLTDMRAITQKSVIRTSPHIKRSICKHCDSLLIDGHTSSSVVENKSKGGKKPWADVLVIKCHTCSREKRFPVTGPTQKRRQLRPTRQQKATELDVSLPIVDRAAT